MRATRPIPKQVAAPASGARTLYRATTAIPSIGAEKGDYVVKHPEFDRVCVCRFSPASALSAEDRAALETVSLEVTA